MRSIGQTQRLRRRGGGGKRARENGTNNGNNVANANGRTSKRQRNAANDQAANDSNYNNNTNNNTNNNASRRLALLRGANSDMTMHLGRKQFPLAFTSVANGDLARRVLERAGLPPPTPEDVEAAFLKLQALVVQPQRIDLLQGEESPGSVLFAEFDDRALLLSLLATDFFGMEQTPQISAALFELGVRTGVSMQDGNGENDDGSALLSSTQELPWACLLSEIAKSCHLNMSSRQQPIFVVIIQTVVNWLYRKAEQKAEAGGPQPGQVALAAMKSLVRILHHIFDPFSPLPATAVPQQVPPLRQDWLIAELEALKKRVKHNETLVLCLHPLLREIPRDDVVVFSPVSEAMPALLAGLPGFMEAFQHPTLQQQHRWWGLVDNTASAAFCRRMYELSRKAHPIARALRMQFYRAFLRKLDVEALQMVVRDTPREDFEWIQANMLDLVRQTRPFVDDVGATKEVFRVLETAGYSLSSVLSRLHQTSGQYKALSELLAETGAAPA